MATSLSDPARRLNTQVGRDLRLARRQAIRRGNRLGAAEIGMALEGRGESLGGISGSAEGRVAAEDLGNEISTLQQEQMMQALLGNVRGQGPAQIGTAPTTTPTTGTAAPAIGTQPPAQAAKSPASRFRTGGIDLTGSPAVSRAFGPLLQARKEFAARLESGELAELGDILPEAQRLGISESALARFMGAAPEEIARLDNVVGDVEPAAVAAVEPVTPALPSAVSPPDAVTALSDAPTALSRSLPAPSVQPISEPVAGTLPVATAPDTSFLGIADFDPDEGVVETRFARGGGDPVPFSVGAFDAAARRQQARATNISRSLRRPSAVDRLFLDEFRVAKHLASPDARGRGRDRAQELLSSIRASR